MIDERIDEETRYAIRCRVAKAVRIELGFE
jgi:hypothetical protein